MTLLQKRRDFASQQFIFPEMYGDVDGVADEVQINLALADSSVVRLLPKTYVIAASIKMNDNNSLIGGGQDTIISADLTSDSLIESIDPTSRSYSWLLQDLEIDNTASSNASSIGIDLTKASIVKIRNVVVKKVETGIKLSGTAYYNEIVNCFIDGAVTGVLFESGANENRMWGGKVNDTTTGIIVDNTSNVQIYGTSIELFTTGISIAPSNATTFTKIIGCRLEDDGDATGIINTADAAGTFVIAPYFQNLAANITDAEAVAGNASNVISDWFWQCGALYFCLGNPAVNGSWRFIIDGDDLDIDRREGGAWVTKDTITAA